MKVKHILVLFVIAFCMDSVGSLFKLMHWANADFLLVLATILKVLSSILFIRKLWIHPRLREFLNW